jgi:8-oxo-dGTP pyrophosphatase MutT (NUDIX family)
LTDGAEPLETAKREFLEETGSPIDGALIEKEGWTEFGDWLGTGTKRKSKRTTE